MDDTLRSYERALARAGFGTPRDVAAALLRSTPARYWLVCGPSYPFPGALWHGSSWWPKEGPAGNANLPFPVTGWTHITYRGGVENGAAQGPSEALQGAHLIAYRAVGIEEAEALKAPFEAHGWSLRLWDAVSQKQVTTYGFATLDAVWEGWVSLAHRPFGVTGWDHPEPGQNRFGMPPMSEFADEHARQLATLDERIRRAFGLDSPHLPSLPMTVDPPLTVRIGDSTEALRVGSTPRERMDHFLRQSGVSLGLPHRIVLYPRYSTWALGQPSKSHVPEPFVYLDDEGRLTLETPISSDGLARDSSALALGRLQPDGSILLHRETPQ